MRYSTLAKRETRVALIVDDGARRRTIVGKGARGFCVWCTGSFPSETTFVHDSKCPNLPANVARNVRKERV